MTNGAKSLIYRFLAFMVYAIPLLILYFCNQSKYATDGSAFGFWGIFIIALVIIMFKKQFLNAFTNQPLLTFSIVTLILSVLFKYIGDELFWVSLISVAGSILAIFFNAVANTYDNYKYIIDSNGIKKKNLTTAISDKKAWAETFGFKL